MDNNLIFGIRPVSEAVEAGRQIEKLYIRKGAEGPLMQELKDLCMRHRLRWQEVPVEKLNRLTRGNHQGVVAQTAAIAYVELADILERVPEDETPLVVIFDGVTDVRNFGAIARSAECAGAHGVIIPKRRSAGLTAIVGKTSAGAVSYMPVARVATLPAALKELKKQGVWIYGTAAEGTTPLYGADLRGPAAIVIGSEGSGMGRLVRETCDFLVSIPMKGRISSLNASAAAAILLYEAVRQRQERAD